MSYNNDGFNWQHFVNCKVAPKANKGLNASASKKPSTAAKAQEKTVSRRTSGRLQGSKQESSPLSHSGQLVYPLTNGSLWTEQPGLLDNQLIGYQDVVDLHNGVNQPIPGNLLPANDAMNGGNLINKNVPAFLNKLYSMVDDPSTDELIHWSNSGKSFIVEQQERFSEELLPRFFRHSKFKSFNRQLNLYGFHKVPSVYNRSLVADNEVETLEFSHEDFQRGRPDLLCFVVRRKAGNAIYPYAKGDEDSNESQPPKLADNLKISELFTQPQDVMLFNPLNEIPAELKQDSALEKKVSFTKVLHEMSSIKRHQLTISSDIQRLQQMNEALNNDSKDLRDRYTKQQETINRILSFLASVFSTRKKNVMRPGKKRRLELAAPQSDDSDATGEPSIQELVTPAEQHNTLKQQTVWPVFQPSNGAPLTNDVAAALNNGSSGLQPFSARLGLSTNQLSATANNANEVAEQISMLDDRLNDITALVNLPDESGGLEGWNMDDFVNKQGNLIHTDDEELNDMDSDDFMALLDPTYKSTKSKASSSNAENGLFVNPSPFDMRVSAMPLSEFDVSKHPTNNPMIEEIAPDALDEFFK